MLVQFTGANDKSQIAMPHNLIMLVGKGTGGIVTNIQTGIMTPKGPVTIEVMETVEEVCAIVNTAIKGEQQIQSKPSSVLAP